MVVLIEPTERWSRQRIAVVAACVGATWVLGWWGIQLLALSLQAPRWSFYVLFLSCLVYPVGAMLVLYKKLYHWELGLLYVFSFAGGVATAQFGFLTMYFGNQAALPTLRDISSLALLTAAIGMTIWTLCRIIRGAVVIPSMLCQNCGYDLTGNTSGRCPECGETT